MSDWKAELEAMLAQTDALARKVSAEAVSQRPSPAVSAPVTRERAEPSRLRPVDWRVSERDEIHKRVESFRAHQRRFAREREQFASSVIAQMRRPTD